MQTCALDYTRACFVAVQIKPSFTAGKCLELCGIL